MDVQVVCEPRIEVVKIKKVGVGPVGVGDLAGCEQRIEVIVKMQKKSGGGGMVRYGGVRVEPRMEVISKMQKKSGCLGGVRCSMAQHRASGEDQTRDLVIQEKWSIKHATL